GRARPPRQRQPPRSSRQPGDTGEADDGARGGAESRDPGGGGMTTSGETPLGIRAQRKQATREELLQTASELFARRGYDHVTVAEIAAGAGVSVKPLFQHFRSKEDLLLAELDQTHERLLKALRERDPEDSPVDALVAWMSSEIEKSPPDGMERWERTVGNS